MVLPGVRTCQPVYQFGDIDTGARKGNIGAETKSAPICKEAAARKSESLWPACPTRWSIQVDSDHFVGDGVPGIEMRQRRVDMSPTAHASSPRHAGTCENASARESSPGRLGLDQKYARRRPQAMTPDQRESEAA